MKSKQLNFYITPEDVDALYRLVRSIGWSVVPARLESDRVCLVDTNPLSSFLVLNDQLADIKTQAWGENGQYVVQIINSPVIEFWVPPVDLETCSIHRGRIYFTCECFNDSILVEKNKDFLNASKSLMLSIRKYLRFIKGGELGGVVVSQNAKKWIEENKGQISLNNIPAGLVPEPKE